MNRGYTYLRFFVKQLYKISTKTCPSYRVLQGLQYLLFSATIFSNTDVSFPKKNVQFYFNCLVIISSTCTSVMSLVHEVHEGYKLCLKYHKKWSITKVFFTSQGHEASQVPKKYPKSLHNISSTNINPKKKLPTLLGLLT